MAESVEELQRRLEAAIAPGFRERLLDRGLARGLIWRDGTLPPGSPPFAESLTDDLLDYAHSLLAMALRLRSENAGVPSLQRAFLVAGEAIEAAVHRGDAHRHDRGFNRVSAAVAFHLARYAARAYSMLPNGVEAENLSPTEAALVQILRRSLDEMHARAVSWLLADEHQDVRVAARLKNDPDFDETDAIHTVLTTSFMRGLALFDHAITTGQQTSASEAKRRLLATVEAAKDMNAVSHWWTATLASHLIDELWHVSLHRQIPLLPHDTEGGADWNALRLDYIQRLRTGRRSAIELWPSQFEAARRAIDPSDDLVVALPTSAGKTRIAELCILRALASDRRVVYITPLRALSAQVERDLAETFLPLGFSVSSLYGSAGIESGDADMLREGKIVVSTPEKLDFALRNDPAIINDVGLIVLDEGHMLGINEREVRYEALVQRLLRRADAGSRRIVCLSALFPTPEEMGDLVAWIRQDEPGSPVHSTWRPTRQRFGVLQWLGNAARLDVKVEGESPFVPRFIESVAPPQGSKRISRFPNNKNELTLATAWRFVSQEKEVLIYCALKVSVETLGKLLLKCIKQGVLQPLRPMNERIRNAMATGTEWLGAGHPAVECLKYGIALHHGGLPRPFLNEVERLLRTGDCPLTIASPTLAQGLNLSASVLLVPSIWRNQKVIPPAEFANVAGRAGRAFVDVEGLVLHVVWEADRGRRDWAVAKWNDLVAKAKGPKVLSGLLLLTYLVCKRVADGAGVPIGEVLEYVTGHDRAWDFNDDVAANVDVSRVDWERDIASLDSAILALLEAETNEGDLEPEIASVLEGSLFSKQLSSLNESSQTILNGFLLARAHRIWSQSTTPQRRGYHVAGVGLSAGQFLDTNINELLSLLTRTEAAVVGGDATAAADNAIGFARLVFRTPPFRPQNLPARWEDALRAWLGGRSASDVIRIGGEDGVDLLQDALAYRLPWSMEAIRVYALAIGHDDAESLQGIAAMAVESGSASCSVITLLRAGLASRDGAIGAVSSTETSFDNRRGMKQWLRSDEVKQLSLREDWPSAQSRHAWVQFLEGEKRGARRAWRRHTQSLPVLWQGTRLPAGSSVVIEPNADGRGGRVLTPDMVVLGVFTAQLENQRSYIVNATVEALARTVLVEYFGPPL